MSTDTYSARSPPEPSYAHSPRSPPLSHFEDHPEDGPYEQMPEDAVSEDELPYPEPGSEQTLLPPQNFRPFFTLIEDASSGEHYHPYVHYIFADDDPISLTAASLRSLGLDDTKYLPQHTSDDDERQHYHDSPVGDDDETTVESPLPPPIPGVKEHYLVIDVDVDGRTIVDAQSLSSEWQITNTGLRTAPSFDESSPEQGYMLQIEGISISAKAKAKGKGPPGHDKLSDVREKNHGDIFRAIDGLMQDIDGGLEVARSILRSNACERVESTMVGTTVDSGHMRMASEV